MIRRLFNRIHNAEKHWSTTYGKDISTPRGRRQAWWHFQLSDHAFIRTLWTNLYEVAPGVWRSNQPSPQRLRRHHEMGIRTILNLRGKDDYSYYLFEHEAAAKLGMQMIDLKILARATTPRENFLTLLDTFETIDRPFVMHCKSGADRTGIAAALWLLHMEGRPLSEARLQLSRRFVHFKSLKTGILDHILDAFEADTARQPMPIREWIARHYDAKALQASFNAQRAK